jgi:hypothetical protein
MMTASMETMLELWASSLRDVKARIRPWFTQARVAASACLFLDREHQDPWGVYTAAA